MDCLNAVWSRLTVGASHPPDKVRLDDDHADGAEAWPPLVSDACYFAVDINELFLHDRRVWWQTFTPTVWTSTQFAYAGSERSIPYLIGPNMLGNDLGVPEGMLYRNVRVAGPHPYKGGPLTFSLVLNRVKVGDAAASVLSVLEGAVKAFGLATALLPYLTIAQAVIDGFQVLLHLGSSPLMGVRDSLTPDDDEQAAAAPGYYALLQSPISTGCLWVRGRQLLVGDAAASAVPLRDRSYVLYSIRTLPSRNDREQFSDITGLWAQVEAFAQRPESRNYQAAKALMTELGIRLRQHPDFITAQADALYSDWAQQMVDLHDERVRHAPKGADELPPLSPEQQDIANIVAQVMTP
jgi:hypothetical protein